MRSGPAAPLPVQVALDPLRGLPEPPPADKTGQPQHPRHQPGPGRTLHAPSGYQSPASGFSHRHRRPRRARPLAPLLLLRPSAARRCLRGGLRPGGSSPDGASRSSRRSATPPAPQQPAAPPAQRPAPPAPRSAAPAPQKKKKIKKKRIPRIHPGGTSVTVSHHPGIQGKQPPRHTYPQQKRNLLPAHSPRRQAQAPECLPLDVPDRCSSQVGRMSTACACRFGRASAACWMAGCRAVVRPEAPSGGLSRRRRAAGWWRARSCGAVCAGRAAGAGGPSGARRDPGSDSSTMAWGVLPRSSCGRPITQQDWTAGCSSRAASISAG